MPDPMKPRSHEVTDGFERAPARHVAGHRHDRRRLGQVASGRVLVVERGHTVQHAARPSRQAIEGRRARRRRVPHRVHDDRGLRWHLHGTRGHAGVARLARGDRRLHRDGDACRALRRARDLRRLRQVAARNADGRGQAQPAVGLPLRRIDSPRSAQRPSPRHRERVRGRRRVRRRHDHRGRVGSDRDAGVPDHRQLRRDVHRQHDGVDRRGHRHVAAGFGVAARGRPPARRLRVRVGPCGGSHARARPAPAPDHDEGGVRERHRRHDGPRWVDERGAPSPGHRGRGSSRASSSTTSTASPPRFRTSPTPSRTASST